MQDTSLAVIGAGSHLGRRLISSDSQCSMFSFLYETPAIVVLKRDSLRIGPAITVHVHALWLLTFSL